MDQKRIKTCWLVVLAGAALSAVTVPWAMADGVASVIVARDGLLNLRNGDVVAADLPDLREKGWGATQRVLIVTDGPMTEARRAELETRSIRHLGYVPSNSFFADVSKTTAESVREIGWIQRVVTISPTWKMAPELSLPERNWTEAERLAMSANRRRLISVWLFRGDNADQIRAWANSNGSVVRGSELVGGGECVSLEVSTGVIPSLASLATVQWVEEFPEYGLRSNTTVRWMVQSPTSGSTPFYARGITGSGQILGLVDGRLGQFHCSFSDPESDPPGPLHRKILAYNTSSGYELHGTHVGGTAVGDGGAFDNTRGVAYGARLVYNYYPSTTEESVGDRFELHASQGARVHNNSWGRLDGFNGYDGPTRAIDSLTFEKDENLIVFAVANATNISNPENAKNSLAVGAVQLPPNENLPYSSSATGPTIDGRRKPEVMSPGGNIQSSGGASGCGTTSQSGTSMAAPSVSGAALLLRQYFIDGFYPSGQAAAGDGFTPSGALLKCMIVNSAVDVTGIAGFPSTREGWGRVVADNAAYFYGDTRTLVLRDVRNADPRAMVTGSMHELRFSASENDQLKITLAWFDAPAIAGVTFAPVNNLDLEVESPTGEVYRGNFFVAGASSVGGVPDAINNLEQVLFAAPTNGEWIIRIRGTAVNEGPQGYAVVVTGAVTSQVCIGDFDYSGATDSDDIIGFFSAWDMGEDVADVNRSGAVDSDDVIDFFGAWDSGC